MRRAGVSDKSRKTDPATGLSKAVTRHAAVTGPVHSNLQTFAVAPYLILISPYLPISPHISLISTPYLPISPHISPLSHPYLVQSRAISPKISRFLNISPHISPLSGAIAHDLVLHRTISAHPFYRTSILSAGVTTFYERIHMKSMSLQFW